MNLAQYNTRLVIKHVTLKFRNILDIHKSEGNKIIKNGSLKVHILEFRGFKTKHINSELQGV